MSKKDSQMQKVSMSLIYRGKEIFKPLNTGRIDEHVSCIREWVANIFFYTKNGTTIMIDAGYNYDRLGEKMGWLDLNPAKIRHILITHQDTDHVGAVERDSAGLFKEATIYLSEIENRYLTGEVRRKVIFGAYKLPLVETDNPKKLLTDGDVFFIEDIKVEAFLVPGHTWGHMVYLVMAKSKIGDLVACEHCRNAVSEMEQIDLFYEDLMKDYPPEKLKVWNALRSQMPSWEELHKKYGN